MKHALYLAVLAAWLVAATAAFAGIIGTKHDMTGIPTQIGAVPGQSSVCVYCHVPHSIISTTQLWNRYEVSSSYTPYSSTTIDGEVSPVMEGTTKLCLSCHDGTIAVYIIVTPPLSGGYVTGLTEAPEGWNLDANGLMINDSRMDHDFRNDHPVSVAYSTSDEGLIHPPPAVFKLYGDLKNKVECGTCHNVHDNSYPPFLRASNARSELCTACHDK